MKRLLGSMCRLFMKRIKQTVPVIALLAISLYISKETIIPVARGGLSHGGLSRGWLPRGKLLHDIRGNNASQKATGLSAHTTQVLPIDHIKHTSVRQQSPVESCESNAQRVHQTCQELGINEKKTLSLNFRRTKDRNIAFCPIYKVGTTFWRRIFMVHLVRAYNHLTNPYLIPFDKEYPSEKVNLTPNSSLPGYKVMFTRDPYNRLFSFFVDKLLAPNPFFWKSVGVNIAQMTRTGTKQPIRCAHDVTFKEFIKYVIHTLETRVNIDPHWVEMETNCRPCQIQYDYIGKMEHFNIDAIPIIDKIGLTKMATFLQENGSYLSNDDAVKDTLQQPFTFRARYKPCISFKDAVLRAWHKLRIRGLVGNDTLPAYLLDERNTKMVDLVTFAMHSGARSKHEERKAYKNEMYKDFWHSVDLSDLQKLKKLYETDFKLFGYDDEPQNIFDRPDIR